MHKEFTVPVIFLLLQLCCCQKNQVTLYDQPDQKGNSVTLSMSSNLAWNNFNNKAVSVCVSGLILFYTNINFDDWFSGRLEYVYGGDNHCTNLTNARAIATIRYPGFLEDVKKDSITLYGSAFRGRDYREYGDAFNINDGYSSLILTGGNNWTVFSSPNFQGNSACLIAPDCTGRTPSFLPTPLEIPNFGHGSIYSGRKGCNATNRIRVYLFPFAKHGPIST